MEFIEELRHIRRAILRVAGVFVATLFVLFAVPFSVRTWQHMPFLVPGTGQSAAVFAIERVRSDVVPANVELVTTSPFDSFMAQSWVTIVFSLLLVAPLFAYELWRFVAPGLHAHERKVVRTLLLSALALMFAGAVFAYLVLIPLIMSGLYGFTPAHTTALLGVRTMMSLVSSMMLATGFVFLLPIFMIALSRLRLVPAHFWRHYARHAILLVLIFSAIITPDGSGLSMILLSIPICILYAAGYVGSVIAGRGRPSQILSTT